MLFRSSVDESYATVRRLSSQLDAFFDTLDRIEVEEIARIRAEQPSISIEIVAVNDASDLLRREAGIVVGENEPYGGHLEGDSIDRHALRPGRPNVLIELRHDLIAAEDGQIAWADRLAPILDAALAASNL